MNMRAKTFLTALFVVFGLDLVEDVQAGGQAQREVLREGSSFVEAKCPLAFVRVRSYASFGSEFEINLCQSAGRAAVVNYIEYSAPAGSTIRRAVSRTHRIELTNSEVAEWTESLLDAVRREGLKDLAKPGLVQLDGARFLVELSSGLVRISLMLPGSENDRENAGSPVLNWIAGRRLPPPKK